MQQYALVLREGRTRTIIGMTDTPIKEMNEGLLFYYLSLANYSPKVINKDEHGFWSVTFGDKKETTNGVETVKVNHLVGYSRTY